MMNNSLPENKDPQARTAFWVSLLMAGMLTASLINTMLTSGFTSTTWASVGLIVIALVSSWLSRTNRHQLGIWLLVAGTFGIALIQPFFTAGQGITIGIAVAVVAYGIASNTLPLNQATRVGVAAIFVGFAIILLDILGPAGRPSSENPQRTTIVVFVFIAVFGVLLWRQRSVFTQALRSSINVQFTSSITLLALVAVAVVAVVLIVFSVNQTRSALQTAALTQLEQTRTLKVQQLNSYFGERVADAIVTSNSPVIQDAFNAFNTGFSSAGANTVRSLYLGKPDLSNAGDGGEYSAAHAEFTPYLSSLVQSYGYYDILFISRSGHVLYTYDKEDEFATNLLNGPYADTNLGDAFNSALALSQDEAFISDFAFYAPADNTPQIFTTSPIYQNGRLVGVLAFQLSVDQLSAIMQERTGLGETGETYLVGPDLLFRSESRFEQDTILNVKVDTVAANSALAGQEGSEIINDYRGVPVLSSWEPFDIGNLHWAFLAEIDEAEALAPASQLANLLTGVGLTVSVVIAIIAAIIAVTLARAFAGPILGLTRTAETIAGGDFNVQIDVSREDELGTLARTFKQMTDRVRDLIAGLEQRGSQLATVAEVGTATATILESQRLLQEVVDLTKERFKLYHSHIYLLDEAGKNLVLAAGAGDPGRIMAAEKRSIPLDREQSLVARAARERQGVTVNDVTQDPDFLPNPLLPDTRSELAAPMIVGGNVVGVFDIQSEQVGRFTDADIDIQTTLAAQLATSIQNVRSFERAKAQAETEALVNLIGQRIQRAGSVEDTLQTAIRELGSALGSPRVAANLQSSVGNERDN